jgi:NAD-dependent DNA ligase
MDLRMFYDKTVLESVRIERQTIRIKLPDSPIRVAAKVKIKVKEKQKIPMLSLTKDRFQCYSP